MIDTMRLFSCYVQSILAGETVSKTRLGRREAGKWEIRISNL
jgi:hypothetical protein